MNSEEPVWTEWRQPEGIHTVVYCDRCGVEMGTGFELIGEVVVHHCKGCHRDWELNEQAKTSLRIEIAHAERYLKEAEGAGRESVAESYRAILRERRWDLERRERGLFEWIVVAHVYLTPEAKRSKTWNIATRRIWARDENEARWLFEMQFAGIVEPDGWKVCDKAGEPL